MSVYVGESRGELLAWINDLLAPQSISKVEQCGTGSIYCQVIDSIYGDVPVQRIKFNAKHEYEYLDNFKILQKSFKQHKIDKPIPVEKLVKCRMQDNLEFLQWLKKFWDGNTRTGDYDASGRAGGMVPSAAPVASSSRSAAAPVARARVPMAGTASRSVSSAATQQIELLQQELGEMQAAADGFEKERDFYFEKLRSIEVFVQAKSTEEGVEPGQAALLKQIMDMLYSTEEGFELPENGEEGEPLPNEEEETF